MSSTIRSEIEEKRLRVARLRERRKEQSAKPSPAASPATVGGSSGVEALLASIPGLLPATPTPTPTPTSPSPSAATAAAVQQPQTLPPSQPQPQPQQRKLPVLTVAAEEAIADVAPRECLTYTRQTQTAETASLLMSEADTAVAAAATTDADASKGKASKQQEQQAAEAAEPQKEDNGSAAAPAETKTLAQEEISAIMAQDEFKAFLARTARIAERAAALNERFPDIAADYAGGSDASEASSQRSSSLAALAPLCTIPGNSLHSRATTCLAWSPHNPELLLAGFSAPAATNDEDGLVLVWAIPRVLQQGSEFTFTCQSAVMSAVFSPAQPQCIIGGTHSGQLVLWDMRAHGRAPVLCRAPSKRSHTYPVYSLSVIDQHSSISDPTTSEVPGLGSSSQQLLASLSSDGRICIWSLHNLSIPLETFDTQSSARATEVTAMAAPSYSSSSFVVGGEDGGLLTFNTRNQLLGTAERAEGAQHTAPVLGIDFHPPSPTAAFDSLSRLFLSCSADWTVKLWSAAKAQNPARSLHTFADAGDCVFGVQWSPVHPATFASADGQGRLCLWDITRNLETPIDCSACGAPATCVRWNAAGTKIAVGDSLAGVSVFSVGDKWASAKTEDWLATEDVARSLESKGVAV